LQETSSSTVIIGQIPPFDLANIFFDLKAILNQNLFAVICLSAVVARILPFTCYLLGVGCSTMITMVPVAIAIAVAILIVEQTIAMVTVPLKVASFAVIFNISRALGPTPYSIGTVCERGKILVQWIVGRFIYWEAHRLVVGFFCT